MTHICNFSDHRTKLFDAASVENPEAVAQRCSVKKVFLEIS